ncbi:germination protein YpeB [Gottfriedia acidiceleris]|uniref:germination protein YpeB n=1 Tax=Bacillaceae TaxID=186817 RepID=UPI000BEE1B2D|nr:MULTISPECIES: germination protein YpeB [unclassified Bacillus (in: firmicutes)]PEC48218.1 germination protein YpeB [Bacillus sp. AFS096315]PFM83516.1 germination protein YpeB [Bacillus sp. AFS077874]
MIKEAAIGVLAIGLIGTSYWGYTEHKAKNEINIQAENNYQRAFHELSYELDLLHDKIGDTLAMKSKSSLSPALVEVWGLTSQARSNVGQLPLRLLPVNKTEEFLTNIGDFSYRTAVRDLDKEPLTQNEYATLQKLYDNSAEIQGEIRKVQHMVFENKLRWMDVELAYAKDQNPKNNVIIDGFKTVERNVMTYSDANADPSLTNYKVNRASLSNVKGEKITTEQAKDIAKKFLELNSTAQIKVDLTGEKLADRYYSLEIREPKTNSEIYMDITEKGGYPVWVIDRRNIKAQKIDLNQASINGLKFLVRNKFSNMELTESSQYDTIGVFTYVTKQDGVRIYPESVTMKIALDDGSIVGFSSRNYLAAYTKRTISKPKISVEEARNSVSSNLKIMEERKAIILNKLNQEVLCYEFVGTRGNDTYQIFVNADTGVEEQIKKLNVLVENYD